MEKIGNIYFFSDPHYHHKNICRGVSQWEVNEGNQRTRDFKTLEEMDDTLVNNFNSIVKENDEAWCLGDWSFGGHEQIKIFRNRLNCKNINLVFGNHDQHIEPNNSPYRDLFKSVQYVKQFSLKLGTEKTGKFGKQGFFLSHYGHRVWDKSHHGNIHLFGHSHGTLPMHGKSMDVGVDTNNLYPYHLDEIMEIMVHKQVKIVDHHNQNTN